MTRVFLLVLLFMASVAACEYKPVPSNATAQSNIRRYVKGTQLQIVMINCNEDSLTKGLHVYCDAYVRDAREGNQKFVRLRCDRISKGGAKNKIYHDSFGCILNMPP